MRRHRSRGRVAHRNANTRIAPRFSDFDERWLRQYSERQWSRLVDLTKLQDRRRWHPNRLQNLPVGPAPRGLQNYPRIVIVPEGHRLARLAPYGGRVRAEDIVGHAALGGRARLYRGSLEWLEERRMRARGAGKSREDQVYDASVPAHISRRVGWQHPWQVMICVRRKRRKEVMFAIGKAGAGGGMQRPPRRNFWSEVRC